jgi:dienelactone hydrolase
LIQRHAVAAVLLSLAVPAAAAAAAAATALSAAAQAIRTAEEMPAAGDAIPATDRRAEVRTLNTPHQPVPPTSREAWLARARHLREQVLVSAGLWPLPERPPLEARVFGRVERGNYSVEKVLFQSHPGFYVTGNLYRPVGRAGPFPAVLSPHGHWAYGRLENSATGSIPGRAITLARQGYVVFSPDMVGYNDSRQVDHRLLDPRLAQWGIGSLSLHLWNAIRSLDFLESLPDVDRTRLAATGASGGATQTFLLSAVDERVRVSAPVNMISHTMQGGDVCENAPNLRLDTDNIELGALMAPRPMLMVAATGDWTRDTPRVEFPLVRAVYERLGASPAVDSVQFDAGHNYNRESREAMYAWFGRHLLAVSDAASLRESEVEPPQPPDLLVLYGETLPAGARTQQQIEDALVEAARAQLAAALPRDAAGLARFREVYGVSFRHALAAEVPAAAELLEQPTTGGGAGRMVEGSDLVIGRRAIGDRVAVRVWPPQARASGMATLVVSPDGVDGAAASLLVPALRRKGQVVASLDTWKTGAARVTRDTSDRFFTTYNRTDDALRAQDILTALVWLGRQPGVRRVSLVGVGRAGLWALLAAGLHPGLHAVAADVDGFPTADDAAYLERVFVPLFRRAGAFETALLLALGRHRTLVHGTAGAFDTARVEASARALGAAGALQVRQERASDEEVATWLVHPESLRRVGRRGPLPSRSAASGDEGPAGPLLRCLPEPLIRCPSPSVRPQAVSVPEPVNPSPSRQFVPEPQFVPSHRHL